MDFGALNHELDRARILSHLVLLLNLLVETLDRLGGFTFQPDVDEEIIETIVRRTRLTVGDRAASLLAFVPASEARVDRIGALPV